MLNPRRLEILRAVLAAGSINRAARNLSYSPATISQHMSALARETGLVLFEKQGRGIVATDAARHLADQAQPLLADFGRLERVVTDLRSGQGRHLAVACFASAAERWMPAVVRAVHDLQPNLTVEISLNEPVDGRGRRQPDLDIRTEPADSAGLRLDDHRAALSLVAAGIGVTVLPRLAVPELFEGIVALPLVQPAVARRIVVHAGQDRRRAALISCAVEQLRVSAGAHPAA